MGQRIGARSAHAFCSRRRFRRAAVGASPLDHLFRASRSQACVAAQRARARRVPIASTGSLQSHSRHGHAVAQSRPRGGLQGLRQEGRSRRARCCGQQQKPGAGQTARSLRRHVRASAKAAVEAQVCRTRCRAALFGVRRAARADYHKNRNHNCEPQRVAAECACSVGSRRLASSPRSAPLALPPAADASAAKSLLYGGDDKPATPNQHGKRSESSWTRWTARGP